MTKIQLGLIFLIPLLIVGLIGVSAASKTKREEKLLKEYCEQNGYNDVDVKLFCKSMSVYVEDFVKSEALEKHYLRFINGETTDFMKRERDKKAQDNANSSGLATGIAVGMATSAAMNSGR